MGDNRKQPQPRPIDKRPAAPSPAPPVGQREIKMSDNKYKIFRNFMVNELGITREDIKEWTMQAIKETVEKELRGIDLHDLAVDSAKKCVADPWTNQRTAEEAFRTVLTGVIKDQLVISLHLKE